ncbi:MAG TPA: neutral/alkaline non-lysosomal ceramidase N-terminal domain-containing protein [Candidatus Sulfotelmatobacter sp.]|nr:neutral/alkaline non-lysosomal ceramidase N-terminal domain-containing protein [Candidatus Sulfotelmatobacter sp.]
MNPPPSAAAIQAGVAQVDITPPPGLPMYGFFERIVNHRVATGTLDPLYARALVLQAGEKRLALVALDLGRTFNEPSLARLRAMAREGSRVDALVVTASHTHSGPNILDEYPGGGPPAWESVAIDKIAGAIHRAALNLEPARLGAGYGDAYIGYNRRRVGPDGGVTMVWSDPDKNPYGPFDSTVGVIRVDREDGTPIAILVNYACHPVVLGSDNLQYSADFAGQMAGTVAAAFGGKPLCIFLQGAAGDINPYFAGTPLDKGAVQKRDWTGRELGTEAARVAKEIQTRTSPAPSLEFADDVIVLPWRWDPQRLRADLLRANGPLALQDHAGILDSASPPSELAVHVTTVLIDRQIAIVGMPGEPFVDFQVGWRSRCPVRNCFFLGYTNGYFDYFPTILAASQGGYGAGDSNTYVAVGAGERMLDQALVRIHQMLGELNQAPRSENWVPPVRKAM